MKKRETTRKVKGAVTVVERNPIKKRFSASISKCGVVLLMSSRTTMYQK